MSLHQTQQQNNDASATEREKAQEMNGQRQAYRGGSHSQVPNPLSSNRTSNLLQRHHHSQLMQTARHNMMLPLGMITDIVEVAPSMMQLANILRAPATLLHRLLKMLHTTNQHAITMTSVLKFGVRTARETERGLLCSPKANFFMLQMQQKTQAQGTTRNRNWFNLVGLRCARCKNREYIKGSTNFVNMAYDKKIAALHHAIRNRRRHLAACPEVAPYVQGLMFAFEESQEETARLNEFLKVWVDILFSAQFQALQTLPIHSLQTRPMNPNLGFAAHSQHPADVIARQRPPPDTGFFEDLDDSVTFASSVVDGSRVVLQDLSIKSLNRLNGVLVEATRQNFRIECKPGAERWATSLHCVNCKEGRKEIATLIRDDVSDVAIRDIIQFVCTHIELCGGVSETIKRIFKRHRIGGSKGEVPEFWKECISYLRDLTKEIKPKDGREELCIDYFRPVGLNDLVEHGPIPFYGTKKRDVLPSKNLERIPVGKKDIIFGNAGYMNHDGNRFLRRVISENRVPYAQLHEDQKRLLVEMMIESLKKQGFSLKTIDASGRISFALHPSCCSDIARALEYGFGTTLEDTVAPGARTNILEIDYAPHIGLVHGGIKWNCGTNGLPVVTLQDIVEQRKKRRLGDDAPKQQRSGKKLWSTELSATMGQQGSTVLKSSNRSHADDTEQEHVPEQSLPSSDSGANAGDTSACPIVIDDAEAKLPTDALGVTDEVNHSLQSKVDSAMQIVDLSLDDTQV